MATAWRIKKSELEPEEITVKKETDQYVIFHSGKKQAKTTNTQLIRTTRAEVVEAFAEILMQDYQASLRTTEVKEGVFVDFCSANGIRAQKYE